MNFSERYGYRPLSQVVQVESVSPELRNSLWNALLELLDSTYSGSSHLAPRDYPHYAFFVALWADYLKAPLDQRPDKWEQNLDTLRKLFYGCPWNEVFDLLEFALQHWPHASTSARFVTRCNQFLERERSAYRFVDRLITPISSPGEVAAVDLAANSPVPAVQTHIRRAVELFADRDAPDYRNTVKEAISAVEALARAQLGREKGTLGELLGEMERTARLHPALRNAFSALYGYTSDAHGIRHALVGEGEVTQELAQFVLVTCSAFVNYVEASAAKRT